MCDAVDASLTVDAVPRAATATNKAKTSLSAPEFAAPTAPDTLATLAAPLHWDRRAQMVRRCAFTFPLHRGACRLCVAVRWMVRTHVALCGCESL